VSIRSIGVFVAAALCSVTPPAAQLTAQQPPASAGPEQQQPPTFRTEANFVRVDVFATRNGSPVKDLKLEDFQVFEDGALQTVSAFEHVDVRTGIPQEQRTEPNTIQQSRDALKNPRARVFILFLDVPHVTMAGAWTIREPLIRLLDRLMGPEDLVGIMMPRMSAADIVFARKTRVIEGGLRDRWPWGERHTLQKDEREHMYEMCYPWPETSAVVSEMIARKRERHTLEALHELVGWLRNQREERKAVLTLSEGWLLYRRNADLARPRILADGRSEPIPGPEPIGVGPDGRLRIGARDNNTGVAKSDCDADRVRLADIDNEYYLRDLIAEANRSNATFYTVDPRGLAVFDSPIGPAAPPPPHVDMSFLRHRLDSLHVLANNTDGFAVVNSNDLDKGLRRISDDLTSYYLLGYYSTNTKLDGRFRTLKVNVKRPGIEVRARKGYKAATAAEVSAARAASAAPIPEAVSSARDAMSGLGRIRAGSSFYAHGAALKNTATTVWVAGELAQPATAALSAILTISTVGATNFAEVAIAPGQRGFVASVPLRVPATGPIDIRVRVSGGEGQLPLTDAVRIDAASGISSPLMFRRGPATGNRQEPAGHPRFSRTERVRFEAALGGDARVETGRILDKNGTATEVPVTLSERTDTAGQRWSVSDVVLAALAPGDYLIELSGRLEGRAQRVLAAFRVTR
jgi:VWFA-related protein